jgi:choloylglycine hydrolase
MKKLIYISIFLFCLSGSFPGLEACSCIYLHTSNQIIFGRNFDFYNPNSVIIYNPKNLLKNGVPFPGDNIPKWSSKYSSLTISFMGVGYANSGMNEKGLAIGHMALPETIYPEKDNRPAIIEAQWIQYMLDLCANTNEVLEEAKKIRVSKEMATGQHYFIGDSEGNAAIIEFLNGQMIVHSNKDMPYMLLSNDPFEKSMKDIRNFSGLGGNKVIPERASEVDEVMALGCTKINQFYKNDSRNIIQNAFDIQYAMRAPDSTRQYKNYGTQYSAIFDITNLKLYFRTKENQTIREVDFNSFKDNCYIKAKLLDIRTSGTGNVTDLFVNYSIAENRKAIDHAVSMEPDKPSVEMLDFMQTYADSFSCE